MNVINKSVPIFARIAEGMKDHILMGDINEGERIPAATQISKEYGIDIATVNILVSEGIAFNKRRTGIFVAEGAVQKLITERRLYYSCS